MDASNRKCRVAIMREAKASLSARSFHIYVDGIKTTSINNGGITQLLLSPGRHVLGFGIGSKISSKITVELYIESDTNIMCYAKGSRVEAVVTAVDVCSIAESTPSSNQQQSGGNGCLIAFLIVLLLFALGIFSIRFTVFFFPVR